MDEKDHENHFGEARILTVEAMKAMIEEEAAKVVEQAKEKARRETLRGKVGFAKSWDCTRD